MGGCAANRHNPKLVFANVKEVQTESMKFPALINGPSLL